MNIIVAHPGHSFSTTIWWRGLGDGLAAGGHDVTGYPLNLFIDYYNLASQRMPEVEGTGLGPRGIAKLAAQPLVIDVLMTQPDWVLVVCGQFLHHDTLNALDLLRDLVGVKLGLISTESPYLDDEQGGVAPWFDLVTTNDSWSAREHGWEYLPAGFDENVYYPRAELGGSDGADVFFAGTGYQERVDLLTQVDWTGIDLALWGAWQELDRTRAASPLMNFVRGPLFMEGQYPELARQMCGAKIALNMHRRSTDFFSGELVDFSESMNPRCYEIAACGVFQLVDDGRPEVYEVFGDSVGYYSQDGDNLEFMIRYWLDRPEERAQRAARALEIVRSHSWTRRAAQLEALMLEV